MAANLNSGTVANAIIDIEIRLRRLERHIYGDAPRTEPNLKEVEGAGEALEAIAKTVHALRDKLAK